MKNLILHKKDTNFLQINHLNNIDALVDEICSSVNNNQINYFYLKRQKYKVVWELQKKIHEHVKNDKLPDIVLFLEHEHVYTFGKNADENFLLNSRPSDVDIVKTDRGGEVTYHGPGQLVGYPIINLNYYKKSITWFMRSLEQVIINTLNEYEITGQRKDGYPGVWVDDNKICAMGVRISRWVTMHGFAMNINPDMKYFDGMIPCGILSHGVTSLKEQIGEDIDNKVLISKFMKNFNQLFKRLN